MILELVIARGLAICLDGHRPDSKGWGYGENDEDTGFDFDNLQVGPYALTEIDFGLVIADGFNDLKDGAKITLRTTTGEHKLVVTRQVFGDTDDDELPKVTLQDGTEREIDEITLYIRAESPAGN